jgi:hypothetical protein
MASHARRAKALVNLPICDACPVALLEQVLAQRFKDSSAKLCALIGPA